MADPEEKKEDEVVEKEDEPRKPEKDKNPNSESVTEARSTAKEVPVENSQDDANTVAGIALTAEMVNQLIMRTPPVSKSFSRATILPEHLVLNENVIVGRLQEKNTHFADYVSATVKNRTYRFIKYGIFEFEPTGGRAGSDGQNDGIFFNVDHWTDGAAGGFRQLASAIIQTTEDHKVSYHLYEALRERLVGYDGLTTTHVAELVLDMFARAIIYYACEHGQLLMKYAKAADNTYFITALGMPVMVVVQNMLAKLQEYWIPSFIKHFFSFLMPHEYTYKGMRDQEDVIMLDIHEELVLYGYCLMFGTKLSGETNNFTMLEENSFTINPTVREQLLLTIEMLFLGMPFEQVVENLANVKGGVKQLDALREYVKGVESQSILIQAFNDFEARVKVTNPIITHNIIHAYDWLDFADGLNSCPSGKSIKNVLSYTSGDSERYTLDYFDYGITELNWRRGYITWLCANTFTKTSAYAALRRWNQGLVYEYKDDTNYYPVLGGVSADVAFFKLQYMKKNLAAVAWLNTIGMSDIGAFVSELPSPDMLTHERVISFLRTLFGLDAISKIRIFQKQGIVVIS